MAGFFGRSSPNALPPPAPINECVLMLRQADFEVSDWHPTTMSFQSRYGKVHNMELEGFSKSKDGEWYMFLKLGKHYYTS